MSQTQSNDDDDGFNRYNHPFRPYKIQTELMDAIYDAIENYKVGLFESPTGTGKTLSVICSSMTWLREYKKKSDFGSFVTGVLEFDDTDGNREVGEDSSEDEPEWVNEAFKQSMREKTTGRAVEYERKLEEMEKNYGDTHVQELREAKRAKMSKKNSDVDISPEFLPDDYYSDFEQYGGGGGGDGATRLQDNSQRADKIAQEVDQLLARMDLPQQQIDPVNPCPVRIFYSLRTHSQLNQFAHQLSMTGFESSLDMVPERIKFSALASRKQLCINAKVSRLSDIASINDACLDLQTKKERSCEFIPKLQDPESDKIVSRFTDLSFTKVHDIEDLVCLGKSLKTCPYYSVRKGLDITEMIALPYQLLLQESTREALQLNLDDSIVIIDEAHNILDVISSLFSVSITKLDLDKVIESLRKYQAKFYKRLNSGNRVNLMKIIKLCQVIINFISSSERSGAVKNGCEIFAEDIFRNSTGDLVNVHQLERFMNKSKIAYKVESYLDFLLDSETSKSASNPLLFKINRFLKSLTYPSKEGKFFWDTSKGIVSINYMLLDPSQVFKDIVTRSRCVLMCGGTMEPMEDYTNYLFPYVPPTKIKKFSCGHIIPDENLGVFPLGYYKNRGFDFLFDKRNDRAMIQDLGNAISDITARVPSGVVVFFPSYKYLNQVTEIWKAALIISRLDTIKSVFFEPRDSSDVELTLKKYSEAAKGDGGGALILAVVGGKLSEGINFSDELARAVIMVGLPFPNAFSGELIAKRRFIEETVVNNGGTKKDAVDQARGFYENICIKAVNQSIGRSIRHKSDYALIFLIDQRYGYSKYQLKLSGWVRRRLHTPGSCTDFGDTLRETENFFHNKSKSCK